MSTDLKKQVQERPPRLPPLQNLWEAALSWTLSMSIWRRDSPHNPQPVSGPSLPPPRDTYLASGLPDNSHLQLSHQSPSTQYRRAKRRHTPCSPLPPKPKPVSKKTSSSKLRVGRCRTSRPSTSSPSAALPSASSQPPPLPPTTCSSLTAKPQPVTGWSLGAPDAAALSEEHLDRSPDAKPTQLAIPAGSVYYFACGSAGDAQQLAAALNWQGDDPAGSMIRNRRSTLLGEKGFGLGACSSWTPHCANT